MIRKRPFLATPACFAIGRDRPIDYDSRQINNLANDSAIKLIQFDRIVRYQETRMVKPVMNLDEVVFGDVEENGLYTSSCATIGGHIGARNLGYDLTVLPPGKVQSPFHCHHGEEEMFLILEGELRFGEERFPIRRHDVIARPPGGPEVAHQIINTGTKTMRYLSLSTLVHLESCEYPDSGKISTAAGPRENRTLRKMFRTETTVDYYDRKDG